MTGNPESVQEAESAPEVAAEPRLPRTVRGRLSMGILASTLNQILLGASAFVLVPLFLRAWGPDVYGRWLSITAAVTYLLLLDLGGQQYIGNLLAKAYVDDDRERFRRHLSEGFSVFAAITVVAFGLLSVVLIGGWLLNIGTANGASTYVILLLMATAFLISAPGGVYFTVFRATGNYAYGTMVVNAIRAVTLAVLAVVLFLKVSPSLYAVFYLLTASATILVPVFFAWRLVPVWTNGRHLSRRAASSGRHHLRGALPFWQFSVSNAVTQQGAVLVLAAISTPIAVATYVTHRTACSLAGYVGSIALPPFWTEYTFVDPAQERHKLARLSMLAIKLVVLATGWIVLLIWCLLPFVYPAWTRDDLQLNSALLAILLVQWVLNAGWSTSSWSLAAANQNRRIAKWSSANACMTLVLAVPFGLRFGATGVAAANLIADVVCGLAAFPVLAARQWGVAVVDAYRPMARAFTALAAPALLLALLRGVAHGDAFALFVPVVWLVGGAIAFLLTFTAEERRLVRRRPRLVGSGVMA